MQAVFEKFRSSARELSHPTAITAAAMLLAVRVVLGYFSNISLSITPSIKFGFSFLPLSLCGALLGPTVGGAVGALGDIISYILNPAGGAFFPGWTFNSMATGIIFGIFLYKNRITLLRTVISKVIITVFIELALGTLWLYIQFGLPYFITLSARALKQLVCTPIEIVIVYAFSKALARVKIFR